MDNDNRWPSVTSEGLAKAVAMVNAGIDAYQSERETPHIVTCDPLSQHVGHNVKIARHGETIVLFCKSCGDDIAFQE